MITTQSVSDLPARHRDPRQKERAKLCVTLIAVLVVALGAGTATWSAWSASTANTGNTFATGTVTIEDNDLNAAMFAVPDIRPGITVSRCIRVLYTGTLGAGVHLYGAPTAGNGLETYLQLTVTRGTSSGSFSDCTGFTADVANHNALGAGVLYTGTMASYPDAYADNFVDPTISWATNESHWYRFDVSVDDVNAAQGKNVTESFVWEAR